MKRKVIDERGRLFGLINVIDVVVLIVAALLVTAFFVRTNVIYTPLTTVNTVSVSYTVRVRAVRDTNADLLQPGDRLYNRENGVYMGTITASLITDAVAPEPLADGTLVEGRTAERYDVLLTVETEASVSSGRFFASRIIELNANAEYNMITRYSQFAGTIMSITGE